MFNFNDVHVISSDFILSRVTEEDIFKRYCKNFEAINKPFCSEFRVDNNPSCNIYRSEKGIRYKDFGDSTYCDCFNYIMLKFGCHYYEALNIVANDFGLVNTGDLRDFVPIISENLPLNKEGIYKRFKTQIQVISQPFTLADYKYWDKYHISLGLLKDYNVLSAKYVIINKVSNRLIVEYTNNNPIYAYKFTNHDGISYKIYRPYETKYKWTFNGTKDDIEGFDQLNLHGELLIITKSLKDVIVYRLFGYDAISLQGEANKLENETVRKLSKRFDRILVNYDNDEPGIKGSNKITSEFDIRSFIIPKDSQCKDISEYIEKYGKIKTKKLIKQLVNEENIKN